MAKPSAQVGKIKREARKERLSWMSSGGFVTREIKAWLALLLVVGFMALIRGSPLEIVGWVSLAIVLAWLVFVFATGTFFLGRQIDREHDRFARRLLSKEYWKR